MGDSGDSDGWLAVERQESEDWLAVQPEDCNPLETVGWAVIAGAPLRAPELFYFDDECDACQCADTLAGEARWPTVAIFSRRADGWQLHLHRPVGASTGWLPAAAPSEGDPPAYPEMERLAGLVQAEYSRLGEEELVRFNQDFAQMRFDQLLPGDVLLLNTHGPDAWVGRLMGLSSPAGRMGMTHAALVHSSWHQGVPDRAVVWEMFEDGGGLFPMQGSPRDKHDDTSQTRMLVVRYTADDREPVVAQLQRVVAHWQQRCKNFVFPKRSVIAGRRVAARFGRQWSSGQQARAGRFARHARAGTVPLRGDRHGDEHQFCSSLVVCSWHAALGSAGPEELQEQALARLPLHAARSMPTDWSVLPLRSPHWQAVGVVSGFSRRRRFDWYVRPECNPEPEYAANEPASEPMSGTGEPMMLVDSD